MKEIKEAVKELADFAIHIGLDSVAFWFLWSYLSPKTVPTYFIIFLITASVWDVGLFIHRLIRGRM